MAKLPKDKLMSTFSHKAHPNRVMHTLTHSSTTALASKTRSQMLKQHPTGVPYQSKQSGKIYDKEDAGSLPMCWNKTVTRIFSLVLVGARCSQL
ncbi:hypothetical protein PAL_GLEAN10019765 [Pteropus alecto]|uniref:Uncharacterized protein n=1 Tax=Pteropus alecto TaxID=9402 RepID=L5JSF8_PTEAL|nr:hypothetical protein PAL_GLEAN10019765 [Pteropus alecto]